MSLIFTSIAEKHVQTLLPYDFSRIGFFLDLLEGLGQALASIQTAACAIMAQVILFKSQMDRCLHLLQRVSVHA